MPFHDGYPVTDTTASVTGTDDSIWHGWNTECSTCTVTASSTDRIWRIWSQDSDCTNTVTSSDSRIVRFQSESIIATSSTTQNDTRIWRSWVESPQVIRRASREDRERWEAREREYERKLEEEREKRKAAEAKAEALLLSQLTPKQRDEYQRLKRFHVHTPDGKIYRINKGWAGNVELVESEDAKKHAESLCIHPQIKVPDQDNMLAQKLLLETNEEEFRQIANISRGYY